MREIGAKQRSVKYDTIGSSISRIIRLFHTSELQAALISETLV